MVNKIKKIINNYKRGIIDDTCAFIQMSALIGSSASCSGAKDSVCSLLNKWYAGKYSCDELLTKMIEFGLNEC